MLGLAKRIVTNETGASATSTGRQFASPRYRTARDLEMVGRDSE
jgi:hypothetical protein